MINVTKTYLPPMEEYTKYLQGIWDISWVTNNGPLLLELEARIKKFLNIEFLWYTSNGTVPLEMAIKILDIKNAEIITTPFSYVATTNAILWQNCTPVFVDINPDDLCIDADKIEAAITTETKAILATHVYGYPCDVEKIEAIAQKHHLKVIYDAAHAFAVNYKGKSLLSYGDISTCSFHATKVFHTIEGGAIILNNSTLSDLAYWTRQFGHKGDDYKMVGINAKNSEFHAAMGLAVLPHLQEIIAERRKISEIYDTSLQWAKLKRPLSNLEIDYNYAYYPVIFESFEVMQQVFDCLAAHEIIPRRYFFPSLNTLSFVENTPCPVSEDISKRILCLPLYYGLKEHEVQYICKLINQTI